MTKLKYELLNNQRFVSVATAIAYQSISCISLESMRKFLIKFNFNFLVVFFYFLQLAGLSSSLNVKHLINDRIRNTNQRNIFAILMLSRKLVSLFLFVLDATLTRLSGANIRNFFSLQFFHWLSSRLSLWLGVKSTATIYCSFHSTRMVSLIKIDCKSVNLPLYRQH